jgi:hypothetical protein
VLLSGHHARIRDWRAEQSRARGEQTGGQPADAPGGRSGRASLP